MDLIEEARSLFGAVPRPDHFTDHTHCCECAEHDETLRSATPDSIGFEELGNQAWDPMCFATNEAFLHYFPALVRLALSGEGDRYYVEPFLSRIIEDGPRNRRWKAFSPAQRRFVVRVLEALLERKAQEIDRNLDADRLMQAHHIWSDNGDE